MEGQAGYQLAGKAGGWAISRQLQVRLHSKCEGCVLASREGTENDLGPHAGSSSTILVDRELKRLGTASIPGQNTEKQDPTFQEETSR